MSEEIKMEDKIEDTQENTDISYPEPVGKFEIEDGVFIKGKPDEKGKIINTNYVLRMGQITFEGSSDIPTMELLLVEIETATKEESIIWTGYLSPLRGNSFQVSESTHGNLNMGSSSVISFYIDTFVSLTQFKNSLVLNPILKGQAITALVQFTNNRYCEKHLCTNDNDIEDIIHIYPHIDIDSMNGMLQLDRFIGETIKWCGLGDDITKNCEYETSYDDSKIDIVLRKKKINESFQISPTLKKRMAISETNTVHEPLEKDINEISNKSSELNTSKIEHTYLNYILKVLLIPLAFAAIIVMLFSGIASFVLLIKISWNLIFHEVTKEMLMRCVGAILIFIVSATVSALYDKLN